MKYKYYCYMRCSTRQQDLDRQKKQLQDWCKKDGVDYNQIEIVEEVRTGTNYDRPKFLRLMETLKYEQTKQDVCLILIENTRLGRSYEGNTQMFQDLKQHDIKFVVTTCPILDTRTKDNNPASALIIDIVLAVYNWISESEYRTLMERTNAGRESAKAKGVKFGRKSFSLEDLPPEFIKKYEDFKKAETNESKLELLDKINGALKRAGKPSISRATLYNYINRYEKAKEGSNKSPVSFEEIYNKGKKSDNSNSYPYFPSMEDVKGGK